MDGSGSGSDSSMVGNAGSQGSQGSQGAVSGPDFEEEASAAEAEAPAADDGEPHGWVEQEQARWEAVVGRPHLETRTVVRDVFGDHAHSIWRDRYRGQEYPEDPGHAIHCTRNGCSCSFDIRPGGVFDSTLCSLHAERQDPLHGGHPFGQPAPGQDNHRSKECFLCLDDKLRRARESRAAAKAAGPAPRFPRLLLLRFYQFYQRVFLGLYRPMLAGGRCPAARWRLVGHARDLRVWYVRGLVAYRRLGHAGGAGEGRWPIGG